ncbi:MAG TPA: hypothetical protein VL202_13575 [Pararhizobium sp.]|uniref:hypothetical protein n=1 Tax=Pararhizobium sp. TaxID=1977563 RepID=UPI002BDA4AF7|nr:hypothetical protein [Pararhizobium sp.]HTO32191.1 hypothetical protein [Pararhizobium sp.]
MRDQSRNAYSAFAEDHRELGAEKRPFSPTLRLKALIVAFLLCLMFWGAVFYFFTR